MNLSKHFTLDEFTHSQTASRLGIPNIPSAEETMSIITLCENVLEPVRVHFDRPVRIDSGYRCQALNEAIPNSSKTSQHMIGEAADIIVPGVQLMDVFLYIKDNLEFDQVIFELTWVHVSFRKIGNRRQALTASFENGKVHYSEWIES
jgi:zinc D-Ala-D-Ala carboxypeptidase